MTSDAIDTDDLSLENPEKYSTDNTSVTSKETNYPKGIITTQQYYKWRIVWRNIIGFLYLHLGTLYGFYLSLTVADLRTLIFAVMYGGISGVGTTAGAHRLWSHKTYTAAWQLRLLLCVLQTMSFQNPLYEWVRDHRVHHKFTDTDADPHNAQRGFFFSHMGWLMVRKHPDVKEKGKLVDMSDIREDPIVMYQKKFYIVLMPFFCFILPTIIPVILWGENLFTSWYILAIMRYTVSLHLTWLVNSAAHAYGSMPYDKKIRARDNWVVSAIAFGEGWHNYHHVFPWDYKTGEYWNYETNLTTLFIDFFHMIGWAQNLKTVPKNIIFKRAVRTGDGTHKFCLQTDYKQSTFYQDDYCGEVDEKYAEICK